jgi:hypothetical protein
MTEFRVKMTYGEIVDAMIKIGSDEEKAKAFVAAYQKHLFDAGHPPEEITDLVSTNLGYLMGYAPKDIDCAMWERVGCKHPVFGSVAKLGPTGEFPEESLGETDKGELKMAIGSNTEKGVVFMDFGDDISWTAFPPEQARELAEALVEHADLVEGKKP